MTSEEVIEFFAPAQSSVDAVIDWLVSSGIDPSRISQSANKQASTKYYDANTYLNLLKSSCI